MGKGLGGQGSGNRSGGGVEEGAGGGMVGIEQLLVTIPEPLSAAGEVQPAHRTEEGDASSEESGGQGTAGHPRRFSAPWAAVLPALLSPRVVMTAHPCAERVHVVTEDREGAAGREGGRARAAEAVGGTGSQCSPVDRGKVQGTGWLPSKQCSQL